MATDASNAAPSTRKRDRVPQAERSETSRRLMIDATMSIIASEGVRAATMVRIQEVAGVSRGLVGYQFGSKHRLLEAVIDHIQNQFLERQDKRPASHGTGLEQIATFLDEYLGHLSVDPRPAQVMLVLAAHSVAPDSDLNGTIRQTFGRRRERLAGMISAGIEDGSVRPDVDAHHHAGVLNGMLRGIVLQYLIDPEGFDLAGTQVAAIDSVVHDLSARPASA